MNGRPGPVVLVLPEDMLTHEVSAKPLPKLEPVEAWSDPGSLRQLREMLVGCQAPLRDCGRRRLDTSVCTSAARFAENWQLPVGNAFRFQDTFDNFHPLYAGDVGIGINPKLAQRVKDSDLILAIGPRLGEMTTSGYTLLEVPKPKQKLVHIHASAEELNRVYSADLAICATMNAAARSLEVLTAPASVPWADWAAQANADYQANIQPQALAGLPQDTAKGLVNMPEVVWLRCSVICPQMPCSPMALATLQVGFTATTSTMALAKDSKHNWRQQWVPWVMACLLALRPPFCLSVWRLPLRAMATS